MRAPRRPPDTPGWRFPVRYSLVWVGIYLVVAVIALFVVLWTAGGRWIPLAVVPAALLVHGARFVYERRPER